MLGIGASEWPCVGPTLYEVWPNISEEAHDFIDAFEEELCNYTDIIRNEILEGTFVGNISAIWASAENSSFFKSWSHVQIQFDINRT